MIRLMMNKFYFLTGIFLGMLSFAPLYAQLFPDLGGQRRGTSTAQFLKIGQGSRALGMGESFVAIANDAEALYWNPAGLNNFEQNSAIFSHTQWLVEVQLEFAGFIYHLNPTNSLGVAVTYLHTDEMKETTKFQPLGTGRYFSYSDFLLSLTYARRMTDKFSFGLSAKWMQENIAELTMQSLLFDLGIYYNTGWKTTRFGVVISNFGNEMAPSGTLRYRNLENEEVKVNSFQSFPPPIVFRIGLAADFISNERHLLTGSVQLNHPNDNKENLNFGLEYGWQKMVFLRAGLKTAQVEEDLSFGLGLQHSFAGFTFKLDYAYTNFGRLGYVNRFTAKIEF
ncbi:MAG: PorV/PorQ family protein [Caldisericaceae bacterium]|nr:PorV/PorQ family protein [Caldisericaceae bacterium]